MKSIKNSKPIQSHLHQSCTRPFKFVGSSQNTEHNMNNQILSTFYMNENTKDWKENLESMTQFFAKIDWMNKINISKLTNKHTFIMCDRGCIPFPTKNQDEQKLWNKCDTRSSGIIQQGGVRKTRSEIIFNLN